jgi:hypothetical protein
MLRPPADVEQKRARISVRALKVAQREDANCADGIEPRAATVPLPKRRSIETTAGWKFLSTLLEFMSDERP